MAAINVTPSEEWELYSAIGAGKYEGAKCIACNVEFDEAFQVVVCPDCGALHHRACYALEGQCINTAKHGQIKQLERAMNVLDEFRKIQEEVNESITSKDFEEPNIFGASKAELSAFMCIEPNTPEFREKVIQAKVFSPNIFAGVLSPFYQFGKGMRLIGCALLVMFFLQVFLLPPYFPALPLITILMLFFNDYVYLRHCAFKIKSIRKFYAELPSDLKGSIEYYELLRLKGKPGIIKGIFETAIAFLLIVLLVQYLGPELGLLIPGLGDIA
ncbi:MAG: hypothetical protein FWD35_06855 [Oscillospiraceae bacterium]|nr:hypothetical protein [Oscillospiraceae bacterium]